MPNAFFLPYAALIDMDADIDLEGDLPYNSDDEDEEDDDDEMDGPMGEELSGLLHDAQLPLTDVGVSDLITVHHQQQL